MVGDKKILKIIEEVIMIDKEGKERKILAKIDTGATRSSLDTRLASELKLGPIVRTKLIKSSHGSSLRPVIEAELVLKGKDFKTQLTLADRKRMKYKILIGVNTLREGNFLVDPSK
ncbi:MAG: ATP-dependent zinc protease [Nanoarchaeota archaeon]|nr:ATP-dependent zinc protease [Nanoarchaeota archaeon]